MAKFSLGREDDGEGTSSRIPKRQRVIGNQEQEHRVQENEEELLDYGEEVESEHEHREEEQEEDDEAEEEEGEEEEEEEEEEEGHENESEDEEDLNRNGGVERSNMGSDIDRGSAGPNGDGSLSVILTDPDVLDCPICLESLSLPVFQCENGHIACSTCCVKIRNKCPSCSLPTGYNRCRAMEKVLESVKASCRNAKYGCKEMMNYSKKQDHEKTCVHAPCSCPLPDCDYVSSSQRLSLHFRTKHPDSAKRFSFDGLFAISLGMDQKHYIFQEESEGVIFIVNNAVELLGNVVSVSCIGPSSPKIQFYYDLRANGRGTSVRIRSYVKSTPRCDRNHLPTRFLVVPTDIIGSSRQLRLEILIQKLNKSYFTALQEPT